MRLPLAPAALLLVLASAGLMPGAELFNGRDLGGWTYVTLPAAMDIAQVCTVKPDGVIAVAGRPVGFIATTARYHDYRLHAEWRWSVHAPAGSNGGVLVHISSGPKDRVWPLCHQVQTKHGNVGDLLPMAGATFAEPLTSAPGTTAIKARTAPDSELPFGEWNTCDVTCRDDTIEVTINGVLQNRVTRAKPAAGQVGFQLEGVPFELRHVRLDPLD